MDNDIRQFIKARSGGICEAFIVTQMGAFRCGAKATEIHHMLTKGRGGEHLDPFTHYHLLHMCSDDHRASDGGDAYEGGLLIEGSVQWDKLEDRPIYTGPDPFLSKYFGETTPFDVALDDYKWFY